MNQNIKKISKIKSENGLKKITRKRFLQHLMKILVLFQWYFFFNFRTLAGNRTLENRTFVIKSQPPRGVNLKSCGPANDWFCTFGMDTCHNSTGIAHSHMTLLGKPLIFGFIWEKPQIFGFIWEFSLDINKLQI